MNTAPAERTGSDAGVRRTDARAGAEDQRRVHASRSLRDCESMGPGVPARRKDAGHRKAPAGSAWSPPMATMSAPVTGLPTVDARGQGGLLDVALDPAFAKNGLIYWSYSEPRRNRVNNSAVARGTFVDGAEGRKRAGHFPPGALARLTAALRRAAGVRATASCSSRSAIGRSRRAGCSRRGWTACSARSSGSIPMAPSPRTIRSSAKTASVRRSGPRPPQRAGGDDQPGDGRAVGSGARHPRR